MAEQEPFAFNNAIAKLDEDELNERDNRPKGCRITCHPKP